MELRTIKFKYLRNIIVYSIVLWISLFIIMAGAEYYLVKLNLISDQSYSSIVFSSLIQEIIIVFILYIALKKDNEIKYFLKNNFINFPNFLNIVLAIAIGFFLAVSSEILLEFSSEYLPDFNFENYYDNITGALKNIPFKIVYLFLVGFISSIIEELFFRGYCYTYLRKTFGIGYSLFINTIIFSAFHPVPVILPSIILFNIVCCLGLEYSKSLIIPICIHVIFNSTMLLINF